MIETLKKQRDLLADLIHRIKSAKSLNDHDCNLYDETTKQVEKKLKELCEIAFQKIKNAKQV